MVIDAHYLPCLEYFSVISEFDEIKLEVQENYQKQTYRNRCKILATNKIDVLIIPVINGNSKEIVKNIKIDYNQDWVRRHLGAIKSAYGKAPYFEHFYDYFRIVFEKKPDFLIELNFELLTVCLKLAKINKKVTFTEKYETIFENDFRGKIHPKKDSGLLNSYISTGYSQNFGEKFVPNLSVIDVLMCQGPRVSGIIKGSNANLNIISSQSV